MEQRGPGPLYQHERAGPNDEPMEQIGRGGFKQHEESEVDDRLTSTEDTAPADLPDPSATAMDVADVDADSTADLTDQQILEDPIAAVGPSSGWEDPVQEGDEVYVPPTDPVVKGNRQGEIEVLGGFDTTSAESAAVAPSAMDNRLGDEAIADAVRDLLRSDAATTDLAVDVVVRQGVVHLRGQVADLDDAENAESVAYRVPGVREVIDELEVTTV